MGLTRIFVAAVASVELAKTANRASEVSLVLYRQGKCLLKKLFLLKAGSCGVKDCIGIKDRRPSKDL